MTGPVYTIENECQDCYKCVRHCHCKAIRIVNGKASVIPENCVACGECVKVCPSHAKMIRSDLARLKQLLEEGGKIYASVAPSFPAYFPGVTIGQIASALKKIGFSGVSETALGAEVVSCQTAAFLKQTSSVCHFQRLSSLCRLCPEISSGVYPEHRSVVFTDPCPLPCPEEPFWGRLQSRLFRPLRCKKERSGPSSGYLGAGIDVCHAFRAAG